MSNTIATNCLTSHLFHDAYAIGGISPQACHIEFLPGGYLVGISGGNAAYTRQIFPTAEELVQFIRSWAAPKP